MTIESQISELLSSSSLLKVDRCHGGGNNRTYRVETDAGVFAAKQYFSHPDDPRDRLSAEFSFLTYAHQVAPGMVPKPLAHIPQKNIALYEYIEGEKLGAGEITQKEVDQAIEFFCRLNASEWREEATALGNASEACFSIAEHFRLIKDRIEKLEGIVPDTEEKVAARHAVEELKQVWKGIVKKAEGLDLERFLQRGERCISPSDFGFHNAIKAAEGRIRFIDFEYAGWDDPAKMTGDFFAQLAVPVPGHYFDRFVRETMAMFSSSERMVHRAKILRRAYRVKWCCIALNVFLPHHLERRKFAGGNLDVAALQRSQLSKCKTLMQSFEEEDGLH